MHGGWEIRKYSARIATLLLVPLLVLFAANAGRTETARASEPAEFGGPFKPAPSAPDPGLKAFAESKVISAANGRRLRSTN